MGDNFGIAIAYRQTRMKDRFSSKSYFFNISPYFQYKLTLEKRWKLKSRSG